MYRNERHSPHRASIDHGPEPYVVDIEKATIANTNFRTTLWTGHHLQLAVMSIPAGGEIGLEVHPDVDQFLRIESGSGLVKMGNSREQLYYRKEVHDADAIFVPAGTWHNVENMGNRPLKIYTVYAPPEHPHGTVHRTKADADAAEEGNSYYHW